MSKPAITATQEELDSSQAAAEEQPQSSPEEVSGELEIPKKFVGKSMDEVVKSYTDMEKNFHRISSQRSEEKRKREELEQRLTAMETQRSQQYSQTSQHTQTQQSEPTEDPLAEYDSQFDVDPKGAIKKVVEKALSRAERAKLELKQEQDAREAREYYSRRKAEDQEYGQLEPVMSNLANRFAGLIRPERLNSKEALEVLELAAKGATREDFAKKSRKEAEPLKNEKRAAFSESSASEGDTRVKFSEMSLEEMEKYLGRSDK